MPEDLDELLRAGSWQEPGGADEEPLPAGDVTVAVVRVGDTVRRPRQVTSRGVAALLRHLAAAGFDGAPRFLGTDTAGRDVLDFVPGQVAGDPVDDWATDLSLLAPLGALVRRLDEAATGFAPPCRAVFAVDVVPPPAELAHLVDPPTLVGHCDVTPQNVVVRDGLPVAVVDFDLAGPTTSVREVVNTCTHWAQLRHPQDVAPVFAGLDPLPRCRAIADGYRLDAAGRAQFVDVAVRVAQVSRATMHRRAVRLGGGWARMWDEGVGDVIVRREQWLRSEGHLLTAALLDGVDPAPAAAAG